MLMLQRVATIGLMILIAAFAMSCTAETETTATKVERPESLLDKGVASWLGEWEEKWHFEDGKVVLLEVTKGPAGILFTD